MKGKSILILFAAMVVLGAFAVDVEASACRNPGSLLLFPYYNTVGANALSVITITNTGSEDVWIRIVWIPEDTCYPMDAWVYLTHKDTLTFLDQEFFAGTSRGFLYAYVVQNNYSIAEEDYDYLIGQELVLYPQPQGNNQIVAWGINAVSFQALSIGPADGNLQLDGDEYTLAPKSLYFPRFLGQPDIGVPNPYVFSHMILINLTGGTFFEATANVWVFNDNEVGKSDFIKFPCWHMLPLNEFSEWTQNKKLLGTDHDLDEPIGLTGFNIETGWITMTGQQATNIYMSHFIDDASIYAVLLETVGASTWAAADLPFQTEDSQYSNGMLWSTRTDGGDN